MVPIPPLNLSLSKSTSLGPNKAEQNGSTAGMFDGSNWNVNFSGTQTNTSASGQRASSNPGPLEAMTNGGGVGAGVWLAAFGIIAAALLFKKLG